MVLYFLLATLVFAEDSVDEKFVLELDDSSLDSAIASNAYILVQFYAPWCSHCKYLKPQYARAAELLQGSPVKLAKIDVSQYVGTAERYEITAYPTLKLYVHKQPRHYGGGRSAESLANWVLKHIEPVVTALPTLSEVKDFIDKFDLSFVLFDPGSEILDFFETVVESSDGNYFGASSSQEAAIHFGLNFPSILVTKKYDDFQVSYKGDFSIENIQEFIESQQLRWVMPFTDKVVNFVFGQKNPALFFFRDDEEHTEYEPILQEVAKEIQGSLLITYTDLYTALNKKFAEFLGVNIKDMPMALIMDKDFKRFVFEEEINKENLVNFVQKFQKHKLPAYFKSEEIPKELYDKDVRILVGKNFYEVTMDKKKHVLVYFYSLTCGHCKTLGPEIATVATAFKNQDNVEIASIDLTKNEVEGLQIDKFPTILLYRTDSKDPIEYSDNRDAPSIIKFVQERALKMKTDL